MRTSASRRRASCLATLVPLATALWLASLVGAERAFAQPAASAPVAVEPVDPDLIAPAAREAVKRMVATLAGAERMSYEYETEYDALQEDGEMLSFGSRGASTIRRPDRVHSEIWFREGRQVRFAWDGAKVALYDETQNVYATTPRSGDIDSLIDFLRDDIGLKMPVADLFSSDLRQMLIEHVVAARYLGKETLDEVETEHVALRLRSGTDVQLWIRTGEEALPERLTLNFSTADGRPQFRAEFREWDLDPRARDSLFELEAPKGAKVVPFAASPRRSAKAPAQEDAR